MGSVFSVYLDRSLNTRRLVTWILLLSVCTSLCKEFSVYGAVETSQQSLADQLELLRGQVGTLEQSLLTGIQVQKSTRHQVEKIQKLLKLQKEEKELGQKRLSELEKTISELETRRLSLKEKLAQQQKEIRKSLIAIRVSGQIFQALHIPGQADQEKIEAPRRKVLANLVDRGLKEIEALRIDLMDAGQLEGKIQDEKQQLSYLFQDLKEQEGVLELSRQLQIEILKKKQKERAHQLQSYRDLKVAESQVGIMIEGFNARRELEQNLTAEREAERVQTRQQKEMDVARAMMPNSFAQLKGKLPMPVEGGKVVSQFGRVFDARSGLFIFKKGIDIDAGKSESVRSISSGKVAFSGQLPNYGKVIIIDHGNHFYSLCGHLGTISKKTNDLVATGDALGTIDNLNTPLYFEIRSRNVAVNPLQWLFN